MINNKNKLYAEMPRAVRIGCFNYEVGVMHEYDGEAGQLYGSTNSKLCVIRISDGLIGQQAANTFLHEVIHAIHSVYGVYDGATEEFSTNQVANGLCAFWQENQKAVDWFQKAIRGEYD